jgi:hypothetical protein
MKEKFPFHKQFEIWALWTYIYVIAHTDIQTFLRTNLGLYKNISM